MYIELSGKSNWGEDWQIRKWNENTVDGVGVWGTGTKQFLVELVLRTTRNCIFCLTHACTAGT